jgi:flagellar export protein FliJ
MRFRFRLASLLEYRRHRENLERLVLARAVRERDAVAGRLDALRRQSRECRQGLDGLGRQGARGEDLRALAQTVEHFERLAAACARELARHDDDIARARAALIAASRERRVLERLEQTQRDAHRVRQDAAAGREMDDVAGRYHRWRAMAGTDDRGGAA